VETRGTKSTIVGSERLGAGDVARRLRALTAELASLTLGKTAPNAELLAIGKCVFKAFVSHDAALADFLGFTRGGPAFRKEEVWIDAEAVRLILPSAVSAQLDLLVVHVFGSSPTLVRRPTRLTPRKLQRRYSAKSAPEMQITELQCTDPSFKTKVTPLG